MVPRDKRDLIERYISGEISQRDMGSVIRFCRSDSDFRKLLVSEIEFSKLIHLGIQRDACADDRSDFVRRCVETYETRRREYAASIREAHQRRRRIRSMRRQQPVFLRFVAMAASVIAFVTAYFLVVEWEKPLPVEQATVAVVEPQVVTPEPVEEEIIPPVSLVEPEQSPEPAPEPDVSDRVILLQGLMEARTAKDLHKLARYVGGVVAEEVTQRRINTDTLAKLQVLSGVLTGAREDRQVGDARWLGKCLMDQPAAVSLIPRIGFMRELWAAVASLEEARKALQDRDYAALDRILGGNTGDTERFLKASALRLRGEKENLKDARRILTSIAKGQSDYRLASVIQLVDVIWDLGDWDAAVAETARTADELTRDGMRDLGALLQFQAAYTTFYGRLRRREAAEMFEGIPADTDAGRYYRANLAATVRTGSQREGRLEGALGIMNRKVSGKGQWKIEKGGNGFIVSQTKKSCGTTYAWFTRSRFTDAVFSCKFRIRDRKAAPNGIQFALPFRQRSFNLSNVRALSGDTWYWTKLWFRRLENGKWVAQGKVWAENTLEPEEWGNLIEEKFGVGAGKLPAGIAIGCNGVRMDWMNLGLDIKKRQ